MARAPIPRLLIDDDDVPTRKYRIEAQRGAGDPVAEVKDALQADLRAEQAEIDGLLDRAGEDLPTQAIQRNTDRLGATPGPLDTARRPTPDDLTPIPISIAALRRASRRKQRRQLMGAGILCTGLALILSQAPSTTNPSSSTAPPAPPIASRSSATPPPMRPPPPAIMTTSPAIDVVAEVPSAAAAPTTGTHAPSPTEVRREQRPRRRKVSSARLRQLDRLLDL